MVRSVVLYGAVDLFQHNSCIKNDSKNHWPGYRLILRMMDLNRSSLESDRLRNLHLLFTNRLNETSSMQMTLSGLLHSQLSPQMNQPIVQRKAGVFPPALCNGSTLFLLMLSMGRESKWPQVHILSSRSTKRKSAWPFGMNRERSHSKPLESDTITTGKSRKRMCSGKMPMKIGIM
jgi:hypothetical protein